MRSQLMKLSSRGSGNRDAAEREEIKLQVDAVDEIITAPDVVRTVKAFLTSMSETFDMRKASGFWDYYMHHLRAWEKQACVFKLL